MNVLYCPDDHNELLPSLHPLGLGYYVCEPGDPRVKKFGWQKSKFEGYLSLVDKTVWISSVWSLRRGRGNLSRMIRNFHKEGFVVKVPSPFSHMRDICKHLNFELTIESFPEAGEDIEVWVLPP